MGQALMFDDSPKSINRNNRSLKLIALVIEHIKMQMLIVFFQVFERKENNWRNKSWTAD